MRIVCISDTHSLHRKIKEVPPGDVLVHAGDITSRGDLEDLVDFNKWLGELPHQHKVVIAGNHDFCFQQEPVKSAALITNAVYLRDSAVEIGGKKFYGSPWQPWFYDWAFNLQRGPEIREKWKLIPDDADVVITHGPIAGVLDKTASGEHAGCSDLRRELLDRVRPQLFVCGHIHEARGQEYIDGIQCVNASVCTLRYNPTNQVIAVDI